VFVISDHHSSPSLELRNGLLRPATPLTLTGGVGGLPVPEEVHRDFTELPEYFPIRFPPGAYPLPRRVGRLGGTAVRRPL
jgi:hypothetical protein